MIEAIIVGRIGKDPEMKYFDSGKVKTSFSLAVDGYNAKTKEKETSWFNVDCWDKLAEFTGEYFKKGTSVIVEGEFKKEIYTNKAGEEKTNWKVNAQNAKFSNAFLAINGEVEKIEDRFTANNKKIQYIKLKGNDITIQNFKELEISKSDFLTCLCTLAMVDKKPLATAVKIDVNGLKDIAKGNKPIVKFSQEEFADDDLIGDDEIPF